MTSTPSFTVGQRAELKAVFTDLDGAAIDPSTVTGRLKAPDGTVTAYVYGTDAELERVSTGIYRFEWPVAAAGRHYYRFESTGTGQAAAEDDFLGTASKVI